MTRVDEPTYTIRRWVVWAFVVIFVVPAMFQVPSSIDFLVDWIRTWP